MTNKERDGLFRVCIHGTAGNNGVVYTRRLKEPFAFADLGDLLLKVERVLEVQDYPQAIQELRTFLPKDRPERSSGELPADGMPREEVERAAGEKLTFDLQIISRRNATWQGMLYWSVGTKEQFGNDLGFLALVAGRLK